MTRRLARRHPRRLQRMRAPLERPEHGLDLALVRVRPEPSAASRADTFALRALAEENALLARELGRVQARCTQWRNDCIARAERLEALLMRARADAIVKLTRLAALEDASRGAPVASPVLQASTQAPSRAARHVLCVGGRARQVPVYRELVERGGDRFSHVDGVDAGCLPALRTALADADLVILQPGYVCQGACQAVQAHCTRHGVRCVQLDKACAIGFARSLARTSAE